MSRSYIQRDGRRLLDMDRYVPYFLVSVTNAITRGASKEYLQTFGVGVMEWRVMTMLALEPGIPAHRVSDVVQLDKAAVSRSLATLLEKQLAEPVDASAKRRRWRLCDAGLDLHDRILTRALEREETLLAGVTPQDRETLLRVMRQMRRNVTTLEGNG